MTDRVRWWKNGDHPKDEPVAEEVVIDGQRYITTSEGKVVKRYKGKNPSGELCPECSAPWGIHGWLGGVRNGTVVHPGDYIVSSGRGYKVEKDRSPMQDALAEQEKAAKKIRKQATAPEDTAGPEMKRRAAAKKTAKKAPAKKTAAKQS